MIDVESGRTSSWNGLCNLIKMEIVRILELDDHEPAAWSQMRPREIGLYNRFGDSMNAWLKQREPCLNDMKRG